MKIVQKKSCLYALILISTIALCSCHKSDEAEPENLLTRFVGYLLDGKQAYASVGYRLPDNNLISRIDGELGGIYSQQLVYNSADQVTTIILQTYQTGSNERFEYRVNYENGLPISGTRRYTRTPSKTSSWEHTIDSALYRVANGKVVRITFFDSKTYDTMSNRLLIARTDTTEKCIFNYSGEDLISVNTNRGLREYTYGTKKGAGSAHKFKFLLYNDVDPIFYSEHDILSRIWWKGTPSQQITSYVHKYNSAGFPISSEVYTATGLGKPNLERTMGYEYK